MGKGFAITFLQILIRTKEKIKVFDYIEYLEQNEDVNVEFFETEFDEYFLLKYHTTNFLDFKTNKKFGFSEFNSDSFEICIHKIAEEKKNIFLKEFKQKGVFVSDSLVSEYIGKLISENVNCEIINILEFLLKDNYKRLKFKFVNEYNFSLMMSMVLSSFSKHCNSKKSFIYSFEKTMIIGEFNRRCDAIYIHENILVVFEFKSNVYKKENPLEYINDRGYVKSIVSYFKEYEPDILNEITMIKQIGLEFFGQNKKHKVRITLAEDLSINFEQSIDNMPVEIFIGRKRKKKQNQSMY
jgi:hypothetical protein